MRYFSNIHRLSETSLELIPPVANGIHFYKHIKHNDTAVNMLFPKYEYHTEITIHQAVERFSVLAIYTVIHKSWRNRLMLFFRALFPKDMLTG